MLGLNYQATHYADQASRLTELHATDLVSLLHANIVKARGTILDVGGGTGPFARPTYSNFQQVYRVKL